MNYLSQPGSARARVQAGVALVVALAIAFFSSFSLGATAAHAVEGTQATLTKVAFTKGSFQNGSVQSLKVKWKAPDEPASPLTITVALPETLLGSERTLTFNDEDGKLAYTCEVTKTVVTCTVEESFIAANPFGISGEFSFEAEVALESGAVGEQHFEVGGQDLVVTIDPPRKPCVGDCSFGGQSPWKDGWYSNATNADPEDVITWRISIGSDAQGVPAGRDIVVTDAIDWDQFELVSGPTVNVATSFKRDDFNDPYLVRSELKDGVTVSQNDTVVSWTSAARAPDAPLAEGEVALTGAVYEVIYRVSPKDSGKAGTYKNSASYTIDGEKTDLTEAKTTRQEDSGSILGKNVGAFTVKKQIAGDVTAPGNTGFTVKYEAFDEANDGKSLGSGEFVVTPDTPAGPRNAAGGVKRFFDQTRVVLTEIVPNTPGVTWAQPVFVDAAGKPVTEILFQKGKNLGKSLELTLKNEGTLERGSFSVEKQLVNDSGSIVAKDAEYTVNWAYPAGDFFPEGRGTITLTAGEKKTVGNIPAGAVVTLSETAFPENPGAIWTPSFSKNDVSIVANKTAAVELTNTITREVGSFSVQKQLDGPGAPTAGLDPEFLKAEYTVDYSYPATKNFVAGAGTLTLVAGGPAVEATNIPVGATVTLGEATPVTPPVGTTWQAPTFSVTGGGVDLEKNVFVMKAATKAEFTLTNSLALNTGGFSLAKQLTGAGKGHVPADTEFEVAYSYPAGPGFEGGSGTLQLPADGSKITETGLPYGAVVTFAETAPAAIAGTTWVGEGVFSPETITIGDGTVTKVTLTNTIDLNTGGFSLAKTVEGAGAGHVPDDAEFEVAYSYPKGNGFAAGEGTLTLSVDGTVVTKTGLPYGAVVTFAEAAPAAIVGTTWNEGVFSPKTITIGDGTVAEVSLTNTIDLNTGDFSLVKQLDGAGAGHVAADTEFEVAYSYPAGNGFAAGEGALTLTADGTVVTETGLPYGAVVTFVEAAPEAIAGTTWVGEGVFSPETITIGDGTVTEVTLTNTIDLNTGSFQVLKTVTGSGAALVAKDATFVVTYEYPAGIGFEAGSGSLTVAADGTAVASDELPYGAVLTLGETAPKAIAGGAWLAPKFSAETVTIGDGTVVDVTLTNTFEKGAQLGATGADTLPALLAGAGALLLGAAALIVSRIRRRA